MTRMISTILLASQLQSSFASQIDSIAEAQLKSGAKGLAIAVIDNGKPVFSKGYSADGTITPDSSFRIASITKQFTAGIIVRLVREKKLGYEDPLGKWIPEVPSEWKDVTIRQLLTHTSGIPSYTDAPGLMAVITKPVSPDGIWQFVAKTKMNFKPGQGWKYNNTAYTLLGSIIEKATKQKYFSVLDRYIFKPLNMKRSGEEKKFPVVPSFDGEGKPSFALNMDWPYSAGAIVSTANDMAKWDAALRGKSLFTDAEKEMMFTPDPVSVKNNENYGFGWVVRTVEGKRVSVAHSGGIPGFSTMINRSMLKGTTVIVLSNNESNAAGVIASKVMRLLEPGVESEPPKGDVDTKPELTSRHKTLFESLLDGSVSKDRFDPSFLKKAPLDMIKATAANFAKMGKLGEFTFLKEAAGARSYFVRIGDAEMKFTVSENSEGKIVGMLVQPA
jgi:D-alanyl-D-alanine carboxypeptidase